MDFKSMASRITLAFVNKVYSNDLRFHTEDGEYQAQVPQGSEEEPSKFGGCVNFMIAKGYSLEAAKNICSSIKYRSGAVVADKWLNTVEVRAICPPCADRMAYCGIKKIRSSVIRNKFAYGNKGV